MNLSFEHPAALLLALVALPLAAAGWRTLRTEDALRRTTILLLRTLLLVALAVVLAGPSTRREHDQITVIGVLDVSGSVRRFARIPEPAPGAADRDDAADDAGDDTATATDDDQAAAARRTYVRHMRRWFREATGTRADDDRFGLVVFDGEAIAVSAPTLAPFDDTALDVTVAPGTDVAAAIRLALAMFPPDSARRLVLVSDGNETTGSAVEAAREAAGVAGGGGAVPIDVVPVAYAVTGDVRIERLEAPPTARQGAPVTVRVVMESTSATTGRLILRREGESVDLNGAAPGRARTITLPAGPSVHLAQVTLGDTPVNRFEAIFEPDDPAADRLPDNDRAETFTATPGKGEILIVDPDAPRRPSPLAAFLAEAGLTSTVREPARLPLDPRSLLLTLQNYDLVVLDNVPAHELTRDQQELLRRSVHDLGGGLLVVGGEQTLGAGGWKNTPLESILPLDLDPPKELRLPQAALVLVLDTSGSMNERVAGARATQQEVANEAAAIAIESLRPDSLVGVVTFASFASEYIPIQRNDDPEALARKVRGITAGGGTNLEPALRLARRLLSNVSADRKRIVCLSDGRSPTQNLDEIAQQMVDEGIKLTTIAVGDSADHETLRRLAQIGEGTFYPVYNPTTLPRVLVDSVQVVNKPLIKEGPFVPVVRPTGSTIGRGLDAAPILDGLVVTAPRDDPTAVVELSHPEGEPLLARWQAGLGRVAVFTSDSGNLWTTRWSDWPRAVTFWTELARSTARPETTSDAELLPTVRDGRLEIRLESSGAGDLAYQRVEGVVYGPNGAPTPVRLRKTAPGLFEASVPAGAAGNYIVAVTPAQGSRRLAPIIGGVTVTSDAEFRRLRSNLALLEEIVETTGGRRLDFTTPLAADLFDRVGMPASVSLQPIWRTLVVLTVVLLLLDVAGRRLAWSAAGIRAFVARLVARVTPSHVRGRAALATLASLREVTGERGGETAPASPSAPSPPPAALRAPEAAPPDASRVSAALDAWRGRAPEAVPESDKTDEPDAAAPGSTETTSGLLEAKRRLREQFDRDRGA